MSPTSPSDDIVDFRAFLEKSIGAAALRDCAGAEPTEIESLKALVGMPLPDLYLGYLREFGKKDGPLKMAEDSDPTVKTLIEFYQERARNPGPDTDVPPRGVAIGVYGLSGNFNLIYPEAPEREPTVAVCWGSEISYICAQTFRNHLYRQAFIRGWPSDSQSSFSLRRHDQTLLQEAKQWATSAGFQAHGFSDDYQVCLVRSDGATLYIKRIPDRTSLYGYVADERERNDLKASLIQRFRLLDSANTQGQSRRRS
jgi:hypothetical protein